MPSPWPPLRHLNARPMRALLLSDRAVHAAGALVIQGLTLPALIRIVKPQMASGDISEEESAKLLR